MHIEKARPKKYFARYKKPLVDFPNLIEAQVKSYKWLVEQGIGEVFKEFSPISDYSQKKFQLEFTSFSLSESKICLTPVGPTFNGAISAVGSVEA